MYLYSQSEVYHLDYVIRFWVNQRKWKDQKVLRERDKYPMRGASQNLIRKYYLLVNLMFSATSLGLVVRMSLSWYFSPARGIRNLAIWTSVSLSPPWEIRAYPSRTSPRYIMYSHQRSESVSSMSCKEKSVSHDSLARGGYANRTSASHDRAVLPKRHHDSLFLGSLKSKDNAEVALASSNTLLENSGFNFTRSNTFCSKWHNFYPTWWHYERVAGRGRLVFGAKLKAWRHMVFGILNSFSWIFNAISSNKSCPTSMPVSLTWTVQFSRLLNPDWEIQISRAPDVWELVKYWRKPSFSPRPILRRDDLDKIKTRNQKISFQLWFCTCFIVHA